MIESKKLPLALTVLGFGAMVASADIKVNDNFSLSGFVDMSANGAKLSSVNGNDVTGSAGDATLNGSLDQYEMDFFYKFGFFSARADINSLSGGASGIFTEQAFITATLTQELSLGMGRFLSTSGFEAAEPTGLYQYSTSKQTGGIYGGYQNGINIAYTTPKFGLYGAVVSDVWNPSETELLNSPGFEGQISVMPVAGVTIKATQLWQMRDKDAATTLGDDGQGLTNIWASYAVGKLTAAAEFNLLESWLVGTQNDLSGMGWLAMVNFKATDKVGLTLRYSALTIDDKNSATDDMGSEVTFSPSFQVSPNWLVLAEIREDFGNLEATSYAAESTFSF
ncbi:MAG: hypothetical protein JF616_06215 [Fibrobacteres bacterium]|nr:hypothetical protein [Fibrobacterota bacterium]